jgi:hypothetical protein
MYWALLLVLLGTVASAAEKPAADVDEIIEVRIVGTLRTGVVAIGGETTGMTITARGVTWELDTGIDPGLRKLAAMMNNSKVEVTGTVEVRQGVERGARTIVAVRVINRAGPAPRPPQPPAGDKQ